MNRYKIVRRFKGNRKTTVYLGLTLEEAQRYCRDPETASSTCTSIAGKLRTKEFGIWFDSYEKM